MGTLIAVALFVVVCVLGLAAVWSLGSLLNSALRCLMAPPPDPSARETRALLREAERLLRNRQPARKGLPLP